MKLSRTDLGALAAVVTSGALGVALFGPQMWGDDSITIDVTTDVESEWTTQSAVSVDGEAEVIIKKKKIILGDGTEEIVVTVDGEGDDTGGLVERRIRVEASGDGTVHVEEVGEGEHFEWRSESGTEEHVFITKSGERLDASTDGRIEAAGENVFIMRASEGPQPIVYIDGERVERSEMDELTPDRIDRVEVIKGEAAEKLFGPEAVNGVIQIFTKDGSGS